jgi:hypothetical protein
MSKLRALKSEILTDGEDLRLDDADLARIRECLPPHEPIPAEDLKVLAEMRTEARVVSPAFDQLFFPALKDYLLADGRITQAEQFLILRLLYGGGGIDEAERRFLREVRREADEVGPEFEALYQQAMRD